MSGTKSGSHLCQDPTVEMLVVPLLLFRAPELHEQRLGALMQLPTGCQHSVVGIQGEQLQLGIAGRKAGRKGEAFTELFQHQSHHAEHSVLSPHAL